MNIRRWIENQPPDFSICTVLLIDALRDYIRSDAEMKRSLLIEEQITAEVAARDSADIKHARALLAEIERWEVNTTLEGLLVGRPK